MTGREENILCFFMAYLWKLPTSRSYPFLPIFQLTVNHWDDEFQPATHTSISLRLSHSLWEWHNCYFPVFNLLLCSSAFINNGWKGWQITWKDDGKATGYLLPEVTWTIPLPGLHQDEMFSRETPLLPNVGWACIEQGTILSNTIQHIAIAV